MVDMAHFAGLVAGKVLTGDLNPVPYADVVTSTTHKSLRGPRGGLVLCTSEYAALRGQGLSDGPRRSPSPCDGGEGRRAGRGPTTLLQRLRRVDRRERAGIGRGVGKEGCLTRHWWDRQPPGPRRCSHQSFGLTGRQAESALLDAGVVTNRNSVPADPNGAWYTSGVRLGTPALTTLGFGPDELDEVADVIVDALEATTPASTGARAKYRIDPEIAQACRVVARICSPNTLSIRRSPCSGLAAARRSRHRNGHQGRHHRPPATRNGEEQVGTVD